MPPQWPDLAQDLIQRAAADRTFRARLVRGQLPATAYDAGIRQQQANIEILLKVLDAQGWPDRALLGDVGTAAAGHIALHADHSHDLQRLALGYLRTASEQDRELLPPWAHLHDRCSVTAGQPQVYGTQHRLVDGSFSVLPVADPARLDTRRTAVGLPPYATAHAQLLTRFAALLHPPPGEGDEPASDPGLTALLAHT
ncbi:DUF6624 domain-containing protein [Streptomyces sp. NPDC048442]|uniref:DUF6624 domain-containing protein n=1 Tax=Streptomyces sp. NPDC048442 TaxID=3154823 RepID=UPI0034353BC3